MGRKIPGKKHRTIVDPEKQRAAREASLKGKINNPPSNPDDQEVPRSLLNLIELKNNAKFKSVQRRKKKRKKSGKIEKPLCVEQFLDREEIQPGMKRPEKFIPNLIQKNDETTERFYKRVNAMTQKIIKESQFEDKFGVKVKKDPNTGKILKVEVDEDGRKGKRKKSLKKSLEEKRREKKLNKRKNDEGKDFNHLKDVVEFGEVVHRPPLNLKLNNKLIEKDSPKGKKYDSLILQSILKNKSKLGKNSIQLEKEEKQRQFIVKAYRERKKIRPKVLI